MQSQSRHLNDGPPLADRGPAERPTDEKTTRRIENWIVGVAAVLSLVLIVLTALSDQQAPNPPGDVAAGVERASR